MEETQYTIYTVKYELKRGKHARTAYHGVDRETYDGVRAQMRERTDIARIYETETHVNTIEFE